MFSFKVLRSRNMVLLALVLMLGAVAYGFAAANTVAKSGAGDGENTISGYTITNVTYTLNGTNPQKIDAVGFTIAPTNVGDPAAVSAKIKLVSTGSTWYSCTIAAGVATCNTTGGGGADVLPADKLTVVAISN